MKECFYKKFFKFISFFPLIFLPASLFAAPATIDANTTNQFIRGFGASSAWASSYTSAQLDSLLSITNGIGLSMLRRRIPPDNNFGTGSSILQGARDRGVTRVWASDRLLNCC